MDWTCAFDDLLCQRLTRCTLCGGASVVVWGIAGTVTVALAYAVCARCRDQGGIRRVERLLPARDPGEAR
jgi:hypothetical protein